MSAARKLQPLPPEDFSGTGVKYVCFHVSEDKSIGIRIQGTAADAAKIYAERIESFTDGEVVSVKCTEFYRYWRQFRVSKRTVIVCHATELK